MKVYKYNLLFKYNKEKQKQGPNQVFYIKCSGGVLIVIKKNTITSEILHNVKF